MLTNTKFKPFAVLACMVLVLLALFCVIGFASAILVFRKRRYNTFEEEEAAVEVAETTEAK